MRFASLAILPLVLAAASVSAQEVPAAKVSAAQPARARDPNRQICVMEEQTGSRVGGRRVCRTAAEWDAQHRATRNMVEGVESYRRAVSR